MAQRYLVMEVLGSNGCEPVNWIPIVTADAAKGGYHLIGRSCVGSFR